MISHTLGKCVPLHHTVTIVAVTRWIGMRGIHLWLTPYMINTRNSIEFTNTIVSIWHSSRYNLRECKYAQCTAQWSGLRVRLLTQRLLLYDEWSFVFKKISKALISHSAWLIYAYHCITTDYKLSYLYNVNKSPSSLLFTLCDWDTCSGSFRRNKLWILRAIGS